MKTLTTILLALVFLACNVNAQFRSSSGTYPYQTSMEHADVFLTGRPGETNYNVAASNALNLIISVAPSTISQTAPINITGNSATATLASNIVLFANHIWVSALDGDDATGVRGDFTKPFLTIAAGENVSMFGDIIHVLRGQYLETLLGAEGVTYEIATDALVGATNLPGPIFFANNVSFRLTGPGFVFSQNKAVETAGIGQIYLDAVTLSPNSTTNNLSGTWFTP